MGDRGRRGGLRGFETRGTMAPTGGSQMTDRRQHRYDDEAVLGRLGRRLHAISSAVSREDSHRLEELFGIAMPEWRVLHGAIEQPGVSQGEIAMLDGLNAMTVSRAVASLRAKGLIEVRTNPNDRRRGMVMATDRGRRIAAEIEPRLRRWYADVFSVLSEGEIAVLDELLERVGSFVGSAGSAGFVDPSASPRRTRIAS